MTAINSIGMHASVGITVWPSARKAMTPVDYTGTLLLCHVEFILFQDRHVNTLRAGDADLRF